MTKALQLARSFHAAGHRVILVESAKYRLTGHRFSRAVDRFYAVPKPAVARLRRRAARHRAGRGRRRLRAGLQPGGQLLRRPGQAGRCRRYCEVLHGDAGHGPPAGRQVRVRGHWPPRSGCRSPDTYRVYCTRPGRRLRLRRRPRRPYILKSIPYDPVHRLDLTHAAAAVAPTETAAFARSKPISPAQPVDHAGASSQGQEYCTHSTVRDGQVQVYCCCESSAFQVNYEMVDKPEIEAWVRGVRRRR